MERKNIDTDIFMKSATVTNIEVTNSSDNNAVVNVPANNISTDAFMNSTVNTETADTQNTSANTEVVEKTTENVIANEVKTFDRGDGSIDVISLTNITHIFNEGEPNEYKLFKDFNLTIKDIPGEGQLVSIMGASGCGKSRLVRAICGLDDLQQGEIKVYGKSLKEYGKSIPMIFQQYSNYEWLTCLENVMLPMKLQNIDKETMEKRALELLEIVGLKDFANKYPVNMSGGQKQRLSISRTLATNSNILIFDEATGALDIKMKKEVQNIILKIFYETKADPTILNITHSIEEAAYISNKVIILKPNPCQVYKEIDIHYTGENTRPRGEWIFETDEYANYVKEITKAMDEVCK